MEGTKRWRLYGSTRPAPTRKAETSGHERPADPVDELDLAPGDVLYLPRGYWHAAQGRGEPTLHLTVGLTRKTGGDFLHWLADHLLAEADVRADLPFERGEAALAARLSDLLARAAALDPAELARAYRRRVEAAQPQRAKLSFPALGAADETWPPDAPLAFSDGAVRVAPGGPGEVVLSWRGTEFTVAASLAGPLRRLAAREPLTYAELAAALPDADRPKLPAFVGELVRRGVLVIGPLA
ncbi:cupin domain-containing protein [Phenylobacterium sp. J367]|nr:cupin domain-containing protein [Phenylobacterium sp. J367]